MATVTDDSLLRVATPKNTLLVAQENGRMYVADFTECPQAGDPASIDWGVSVSKLLISKIALSRNRLSTLEVIEFENVQHTFQEPTPGAGDLGLTAFNTLDGKNIANEITPHIVIDEGNFIRANCRLTGVNFGVQLRGTYNINTMVVVMHPAGRR